MNYSGFQVVLQEVPGEVSLSFLISGCNLKCRGCHSAEAWSPDFGAPLSEKVFVDLLSKYANLATCVLFCGGEWEKQSLESLLKIARDKGFKTCLYTGLRLREVERYIPSVLPLLDYIKVGKWVREYGGLNSKDTNQRFYKLKMGELTDITHKFHAT